MPCAGAARRGVDDKDSAEFIIDIPPAAAMPRVPQRCCARAGMPGTCDAARDPPIFADDSAHASSTSPMPRCYAAATIPSTPMLPGSQFSLDKAVPPARFGTPLLPYAACC